MDRRKLARINRLGQEILSLESRLDSARYQVNAARLELDRDDLTYRQWSDTASEYGMASGCVFGLERRLRIVRGRFHFEVQSV